MKVNITKAEFLDYYENNEIDLNSLIVTPIAILVKSVPKKSKPQVIYVVNIP